VLPAAGSGSRFGTGDPKQFRALGDRSILEWSVVALLEAVDLDGVVVALPADEIGRAERHGVLRDERVSFCSGGPSRAASVAAGLEALHADAGDWVLVHDAARPCVPRADVRVLVDQVRRAGVGAILAAPVTDTLKEAGEGQRVKRTVDRTALWRALTPQMFRVGELARALEAALAAGVEITDEASAMERAGYPVQLVPGSTANIKITYAEDLALAEFWMRRVAEAV
jgi:2-C-methyl-D-erythritol 4-phosphate cytidylyltransferase